MSRMSEGTQFYCFGAQKEKERWLKVLVLTWGDAKCQCVCRRTKLSERGVHSEKVREIGRGYQLEKKL